MLAQTEKLAQMQENLLTVRLGRRVIASLCPAFMGGLSPVLYRLVVPACQAENVQNLGADRNITEIH
jgi:hypothetical protein